MYNFEDLYIRYKSYVGYLLKNIYSPEDKEDLSQQIWLIVWQKMPAIQKGKEKPFLRGVAYNVIGNYITKCNKEAIMNKNLELYKAAYFEDDCNAFLEWLDLLQETLTDKEFDCIVLHMQGATQSEIGKRLELSQGRVSQLLDSALEKIYIKIGED